MADMTITMSPEALQELRTWMPTGLNSKQTNDLLRAAQAVYEQGQKEGAMQAKAITDVLNDASTQDNTESYRESAAFTDTVIADPTWSEDRPTISLRAQEGR